MGSAAVVVEAEVAVHPVVGRLRSESGWAALAGRLQRRRHFGPAVLDRLAQIIKDSEASHSAELVVVIETHLPGGIEFAGTRALEAFGRQRVWDTPERTGVLLYVALGDHCIELLADRGVVVDEQVWQEICTEMEGRMRRGQYAEGLVAGIAAIERVLQACLPSTGEAEPNRLADRPVLG